MYLENLPPQYLPKDGNLDNVPTFGAFDAKHKQTRIRIGKFLKAFEKSNRVEPALREAGISPYQYVRWLKYPEFRFLKDCVNSLRQMRTEDNLFDSAINDKRAVLQQFFGLKALDSIYRDRQSTVNPSVNIHIDARSLQESVLKKQIIDVESTESSTNTTESY